MRRNNRNNDETDATQLTTVIVKLEKVISKAAEMILKGEYEVKIDNEHYIGFIDLLAPATGSTGGGAAHNHSFTGIDTSINVMPPYLTVYMWKRTA